MNDDPLFRRILDVVTGPSDADAGRALEEELTDRPDVAAEFRRLREAWEALGDLPRREPPEGARRRAREALLAATGGEETGRGGAHRRRTARPWLVRVAAGLVLFLAGAGAGAWWGSAGAPSIPSAVAPAEVPEGPRFVLLIRGGDVPGEEEATREAMVGWARELWAEDRLLWAERLLTERSAFVGGTPAASGPDGLAVGGLFVIRARDREEAVRLARGSPNVALGGAVEVLPTATAESR